MYSKIQNTKKSFKYRHPIGKRRLPKNSVYPIAIHDYDYNRRGKDDTPSFSDLFAKAAGSTSKSNENNIEQTDSVKNDATVAPAVQAIIETVIEPAGQ
jgi:hypothetical protein